MACKEPGWLTVASLSAPRGKARSLPSTECLTFDQITGRFEECLW